MCEWPPERLIRACPPKSRVPGRSLEANPGTRRAALALFLASPSSADRDGILGTTGYSAEEPDDSPATLHDLETVTGAIDPYELVGQRVDFHLPVARTADKNAFWVGTRDNRVLVVPRMGDRRLADGQLVRIVGTIEQLRPEVNDQRIYIDADAVTPEP